MKLLLEYEAGCSIEDRIWRLYGPALADIWIEKLSVLEDKLWNVIGNLIHEPTWEMYG